MVKYLVLLFAVYAIFFEETLFSLADDDWTSDLSSTQYKLCCKCHTAQYFQYRSGKCESYNCVNSCTADDDCRLSEQCCVLAADPFKGCRQCRYDSHCQNGKKCCYGFSNKQTRCRENCLGLHCDSTHSCRGSQECCRNNVCVNCSKPGCKNNGECGRGQSCCNQKMILGESFCNSSCIGARCAADTDCASHECCHDEKCVKCSSLQCYSNSDCSSAYCCRRRYFYDESRCIPAGCIGQTCTGSRDCGGLNECCRDNTCAKCSESKCKDNSECRLGEYCCKRNGQAVCSQSCEGQFCNTAKDCGAPGECCMGNKCTTFGCSCNSNSDCKFGEYCCKSYPGPACNSTCIGKKCSWDSDCGAPGEKCTYPDSDCYISRLEKKCPELPERRCFNKNGCYSHDDCNVFGSGYYCCQHYSERDCNSNCLKKSCNKNSDCGGSSECCDSNNECYKCPNNVPAWIIGISVGISLLVIIVVGVVIRYIHSKRKQQRMESQPSGIGTRVAEMEFQQNSHYQNSNGAIFQSTVSTSFVDDVQSSQPTQLWTTISPSQTVSQQKYVMPYQNLDINELGNVESNNSFAGNRNDENETVVPSAPPLPYPVTPPPHPPPSYQKLFGNR